MNADSMTAVFVDRETPITTLSFTHYDFIYDKEAHRVVIGNATGQYAKFAIPDELTDFDLDNITVIEQIPQYIQPKTQEVWFFQNDTMVKCNDDQNQA